MIVKRRKKLNIPNEEGLHVNTRIAWCDTFRGLMMFAIVWGHALGEGILTNSALNTYLYSFHVPAFFFISGFLYSGNKKRFSQFFIGKVKTLMLPYYIFALVSIAVYAVLGSVAASSLEVSVKSTGIVPSIIGMLYANGYDGYMKWNTALWFIPCLFLMTLLFYPLNKLSEKISKRIGMHFTCGALLLVSSSVALLNYYLFNINRLPFGAESGIYLFPFFIAGYWMKSCGDSFKMSVPVKAAVSFILIAAGAVTSLPVEKHVNYVRSDYNNIFLFYLSAILSILGYLILSQLISCRPLEYMGRNTLPVILMHKFPIVFFQIILNSLFVGDVFVAFITATAVAAVSFAATLLCGEIIRRILPPVLGERRRIKQ